MRTEAVKRRLQSSSEARVIAISSAIIRYLSGGGYGRHIVRALPPPRPPKSSSPLSPSAIPIVLLVRGERLGREGDDDEREDGGYPGGDDSLDKERRQRLTVHPQVSPPHGKGQGGGGGGGERRRNCGGAAAPLASRGSSGLSGGSGWNERRGRAGPSHRGAAAGPHRRGGEGRPRGSACRRYCQDQGGAGRELHYLRLDEG